MSTRAGEGHHLPVTLLLVGRAHLQGMQGMQGMRLDEGCESPVPSVDRSAPLFAFLEGEPGVYISPSGSRENLRDSSNGSGA